MATSSPRFTRRYGTLTYARSMRAPEQIALFDRRHRRYISLHPSREQVAAHGAFYGEDDPAGYTVLYYDVDASFVPDREWIEGRTRMVLRVRAASASTLEVRLADSLVVRSVGPRPGNTAAWDSGWRSCATWSNSTVAASRQRAPEMGSA